MRVEPSGPNHLLEILLPNTITMTIKFQHEFGRHLNSTTLPQVKQKDVLAQNNLAITNAASHGLLRERKAMHPIYPEISASYSSG